MVGPRSRSSHPHLRRKKKYKKTRRKRKRKIICQINHPPKKQKLERCEGKFSHGIYFIWRTNKRNGIGNSPIVTFHHPIIYQTQINLSHIHPIHLVPSGLFRRVKIFQYLSILFTTYNNIMFLFNSYNGFKVSQVFYQPSVWVYIAGENFDKVFCPYLPFKLHFMGISSLWIISWNI